MTSGARWSTVRVLSASAAGVAAVVALSLGYLDLQGRPAATVDRLSIALPATPHGALLRIAQAKGYFAEEGLDLTILPATHGAAAVDLVVQRKADLATAAEVPIVLQILAGQRLGIAATVLSTSNGHAIIARRDRGISSPRDLRNKRIGVTFGASGDYFLWSFLIRHRLPPDWVTRVDVAPGRLERALSDGTVDAISAWQPIVSAAQSALSGNCAAFAEADAYTESHAVVGRGDFLKGHPRAIEKLVRALVRAEQFNRSRPQEALEITAGQLQLDIKTLRGFWKDFNFSVDLLESDLMALEAESEWAAARGYAAPGTAHNFLPNLYLDALLAVDARRVTVVH